MDPWSWTPTNPENFKVRRTGFWARHGWGRPGKICWGKVRILFERLANLERPPPKRICSGRLHTRALSIRAHVPQTLWILRTPSPKVGSSARTLQPERVFDGIGILGILGRGGWSKQGVVASLRSPKREL